MHDSVLSQTLNWHFLCYFAVKHDFLAISFSKCDIVNDVIT